MRVHGSKSVPCDRNEFIISTAVVDRMSPYRNLNLNLLVSPRFFVRVHALRGFNMFGIVVDLIKLHVTRIFAHVHFAKLFSKITIM